MLLKYVFGLFVNPIATWKAIKKARCSVGKCFCYHVLILALIPAVSSYYGTTRVGWQIGTREAIRFTEDSALTICILYYISILVVVFTIGKMIHWMGQTYGSKADLSQSITLAAFTASPLLLVGVMQLYPLLWLNILVGLPALAYTVYLLYTGVPIMMGVSKDRGFLFSTAVLAVGLVMLVALLALTVILWGYGVAPQFTN